jgi:hypothetical protein
MSVGSKASDILEEYAKSIVPGIHFRKSFTDAMWLKDELGLEEPRSLKKRLEFLADNLPCEEMISKWFLSRIEFKLVYSKHEKLTMST